MKMNGFRFVVVGVMILSGVIAWMTSGDLGNNPAAAFESRPGSPEMERKVSSATKIVSGLARENYALMREGAVEWRQMSESAGWDRNRSPIYAMHSREFEQACDRLILAAEQKQTERATFAYLQATVCCITCHTHVRDTIRVSGSVHKSDRGTVIR